MLIMIVVVVVVVVVEVKVLYNSWQCGHLPVLKILIMLLNGLYCMFVYYIVCSINIYIYRDTVCSDSAHRVKVKTILGIGSCWRRLTRMFLSYSRLGLPGGLYAPLGGSDQHCPSAWARKPGPSPLSERTDWEKLRKEIKQSASKRCI